MPRPRSDIRPRILAAARERFLNEGVDGASLRAIAEDARTSIGMIYYYFPTKDDLFLGVVEEVYTTILADLTAALAPDAAVDERLRRIYRRLAAIDDAEFAVLRIVIREALVSSARLERLIARFAQGHVPLAIGTFLEGQRDGTIRSDLPLPALMAALVTTAVMPQLLRRRVAATDPGLAGMLPEPPELARALAQIVLAGLAPPRDVPKP